ncbi:MAG: hypothetical protein ACLFQP_06210 [Halothece sp.]
MFSVSPSSTHSLDQQQKSIMMKKLLFAVCRNYWENDRIILSQTKVEELVMELYESQPTLSSVQDRLREVVDGLNKREKYYPISELLMKKISKLYGGSDDSVETSFTPVETQGIAMLAPTTINNIIPNIIQSFEQNQNSQRIHKMLFALYAKRWENSPQVLLNYPLSYLIKEIYNLYSNIEEISINLLKIVKGLNKQGIYSEVAQSIITELAQLYQQETSVENLKSLVQASHATVQQAKTDPNHTTFSQKLKTGTRKHNFNYNPYEVRRQLMKSANPLQVKILLYYLLNPEKNNEKVINGLFLKTYNLDTLLLQVVQKFKTLAELQRRLETTALDFSSNTHQTMNEVNEKLKVATAIIMSLKPLYDQT